MHALIGDIKRPEAGGTYKPDLLAYYGYYPFGMLQPGRSAPANPSLAGGYRFGYNGKEKDNNGEFGLTNYDYGFRIYNQGLGRFLSVDPLTKDFPYLTPYQFASNTPIQAIDLDGQEKFHYTLSFTAQGKTKLIAGKVEDFTVTTSSWKPTLSNPLHTETSTIKNPQVEYIVHGNVPVTMGLGGEFETTQDVTWTFTDKQKLYEAERRGGIGHDPIWSWIGSDQHWNVAWAISAVNVTQAELETGGMRGLWRETPTPITRAVGAAVRGFKVKSVTAIGRMEDLRKFDGDPNVDTWHKSGRVPRPGEPAVTWPENRKWLDERIDRGDEFWITTHPSTLPPVKGGYVPGVPNGYFTAKELNHLNSRGIKPKYKP